jgi:hypothetical protein
MIVRSLAGSIDSNKSPQPPERSSICYDAVSRRREHKALVIVLAVLWLVALGGAVTTLWGPTAELQQSWLHSSVVTLERIAARLP